MSHKKLGMVEVTHAPLLSPSLAGGASLNIRTTHGMKRRTEISLPPSGADTWTECTEQPWMLLENQDKLIQDTDTPQSIEGTLAHTYAASLLGVEDKRNPVDMKKVTPKMREKLAEYAEFIESLQGRRRMVEIQVPPFYMKHRKSFVDAVVIDKKNRKITIVDLKWGRWAHDPVDHKQMAIYARSVIEEFVPEAARSAEWTIECFIYQPNAGDEPVRGPWTMSAEEMYEWTDERILDIVTRIKRRKETKLVSNEDTCRFCPARLCCAANLERKSGMAGEALAEVKTLLPIVPAIKASQLSREKLLAILPYVKPVISFLEDVMDIAKSETMRGTIGEEDGWKMVRGRGRRHWKDETKLVKAMTQIFDIEDVAPRRPRSPNQMEIVLSKHGLKKKLLEPFYARSEGGLEFVPATDPREPVDNKPFTAQELKKLLKA